MFLRVKWMIIPGPCCPRPQPNYLYHYEHMQYFLTIFQSLSSLMSISLGAQTTPTPHLALGWQEAARLKYVAQASHAVVGRLVNSYSGDIGQIAP